MTKNLSKIIMEEILLSNINEKKDLSSEILEAESCLLWEVRRSRDQPIFINSYMFPVILSGSKLYWHKSFLK